MIPRQPEAKYKVIMYDVKPWLKKKCKFLCVTGFKNLARNFGGFCLKCFPSQFSKEMFSVRLANWGLLRRYFYSEESSEIATKVGCSALVEGS